MTGRERPVAAEAHDEAQPPAQRAAERHLRAEAALAAELRAPRRDRPPALLDLHGHAPAAALRGGDAGRTDEPPARAEPERAAAVVARGDLHAEPPVRPRHG